MIVLCESRDREHSHCGGHNRERPIVSCSGLRVATASFAAEHGYGTSDYGNHSRSHVNHNKRQKERRVRGKRYSAYCDWVSNQAVLSLDIGLSSLEGADADSMGLALGRIVTPHLAVRVRARSRQRR